MALPAIEIFGILGLAVLVVGIVYFVYWCAFDEWPWQFDEKMRRR